MPGIVFALLLVLLFWGGTQIGKATGHWNSQVTPADYRGLLAR
jgi:hypothetical protein